MNYIRSKAFLGIHPTLPSAILTSHQSLRLLSMISTLEPSCKTKRSLPLSAGVLFTVTAGVVMIPLVWASLKFFCCMAHTLESMESRNRTMADDNVSFLIVTLPEAQKRSNDTSMSTKPRRAIIVQVRRLPTVHRR